MKRQILLRLFYLMVLFFTSSNTINAAERNLTYKDKDIFLRFIEFTPEQIAAFYHGREFSKKAINKLTQSCFVTVIIKNKTDDILWVDLDEWQFSQAGKQFNRQTRQYWQQQWDKVGLKKAHRATFGWTLMPTRRDLYPNEGVGGRIPIPMQDKPFSVTLNFPTAKNKKGKVKSIVMKNMICKSNDTATSSVKK